MPRSTPFPRLSGPAFSRLVGVALLLCCCISCVDNPALRDLMRQAAQQGKRQLANHQAARTGQKVAHLEKGDQAQGLDSLLRLASQDVGVDPDAGSVQRAIWRVRLIKFNLESARRSLDNSRVEIFNLAATAEEKQALAALDAEASAQPDSLKGDYVLRRQRLQEQAIDDARQAGRLQEKRLSAQEAGRMGLLLYNLGVGVVCDNLALTHSQRVLDDFTRVKDELFTSGGLTGARAWLSLAAWHQEFLAIPGELKAIVGEAPAQISALGAMIGTIRVLKQNNAIVEREIKPGAGFESMEDF